MRYICMLITYSLRRTLNRLIPSYYEDFRATLIISNYIGSLHNFLTYFRTRETQTNTKYFEFFRANSSWRCFSTYSNGLKRSMAAGRKPESASLRGFEWFEAVKSEKKVILHDFWVLRTKLQENQVSPWNFWLKFNLKFSSTTNCWLIWWQRNRFTRFLIFHPQKVHQCNDQAIKTNSTRSTSQIFSGSNFSLQPTGMAGEVTAQNHLNIPIRTLSANHKQATQSVDRVEGWISNQRGSCLTSSVQPHVIDCALHAGHRTRVIKARRVVARCRIVTALRLCILRIMSPLWGLVKRLKWIRLTKTVVAPKTCSRVIIKIIKELNYVFRFTHLPYQPTTRHGSQHLSDTNHMQTELRRTTTRGSSVHVLHYSFMPFEGWTVRLWRDSYVVYERNWRKF